MRFLTTEEAKLWCEAHDMKVTAEKYLYYESEKPRCFTVGLEDKPCSLISLANHLVPMQEGDSFGGALLWIRERGIWNDHLENTAEMIVQQMCLARGERESLEKRPGHLFGYGELYEMHSFFVVPLLFGWDAFLIPEGKDYFLFVSHDEYVTVVCRKQEAYDEMYESIRGWKPQDDEGRYLQHVDR
jgi:hypothetical protein